MNSITKENDKRRVELVNEILSKGYTLPRAVRLIRMAGLSQSDFDISPGDHGEAPNYE